MTYHDFQAGRLDHLSLDAGTLGRVLLVPEQEQASFADWLETLPVDKGKTRTRPATWRVRTVRRAMSYRLEWTALPRLRP
ncbi:MAG: hypothetical protein VKM98_10005 [Cyanobacteriota bacterium]|nr:hypothetical protein [Cyanobacteriota bacterium]